MECLTHPAFVARLEKRDMVNGTNDAPAQIFAAPFVTSMGS
jgi:hypothetical protein